MADFLELDLQLFDDGATDGGESAETAEVAEPQQAEKDPVAEGEETKPKSFDELINGEYKKDFDSKVKEIVQKRFKNAKDSEAKLKAYEPFLEILNKKYGIDGNQDTKSYAKAMADAIDLDFADLTKEAEEKGVPIDVLREMRKLERQNKVLEEQDRQRQEEEAQKEWFNKRYAESEQFKNKRPDFDFIKEMENPEFLALIQNPYITVEGAYNAVHHDDEMKTAMQYAADKVEEGISKKIASRKSRPAENGVSSNASAVTSVDVSRLTNAEIDEINRRVARGEKITFATK